MSATLTPRLKRAAIDTSFVANVANNDTNAVKALEVLVDCEITIVVPTPLWAECGRGPGGGQRLDVFMSLTGVESAPLDTIAAKGLAHHLRRKVKDNPCGRYVWDFDAQIYLCAFAANCDGLVTDNADDFKKIAQAAEPPFPRSVRIWTSAELAKYARAVQMKLGSGE